MTLYLSLFVAFVFFGYFDVMQNLSYQLKIYTYQKKRNKKKQYAALETNDFISFYKNDSVFMASMLAKVSVYALFFVNLFYFETIEILTIIFGFILGRIIMSKSSLLENVVLDHKSTDSNTDKMIFYSGIYVSSIVLYLFTHFILNF